MPDCGRRKALGGEEVRKPLHVRKPQVCEAGLPDRRHDALEKIVSVAPLHAGLVFLAGAVGYSARLDPRDELARGILDST